MTGSIANVVEVGRIIPKKKREKSSEISMEIKFALNISVAHVMVVALKNDITPVLRACLTFLNFRAKRLPSIIPRALIAKQRLNAIGERPYSC